MSLFSLDMHPHTFPHSFLHCDARRGLWHCEEPLFRCHSRERIQGKARKGKEREGRRSEALRVCCGQVWINVQDKGGFGSSRQICARRRWKLEPKRYSNHESCHEPYYLDFQTWLNLKLIQSRASSSFSLSRFRIAFIKDSGLSRGSILRTELKMEIALRKMIRAQCETAATCLGMG